jgi:hypothetical protein
MYGPGAALRRDRLGDALDLGIRDERTLQADHAAAEHEEQVAVADEAFGAVLIEDRPRVDLRRDLVGDAGREVGLDEAGDDVDGRALRGEDRDGCRRRGPSVPGGRSALDLLAGRHHEVGEFVDDDDDVGEVAVTVFGLSLPSATFRL